MFSSFFSNNCSDLVYAVRLSGARVREVSLLLATSRLFSPKHLGGLSYENDPEATGNINKTHIDESLR